MLFRRTGLHGLLAARGSQPLGDPDGGGDRKNGAPRGIGGAVQMVRGRNKAGGRYACWIWVPNSTHPDQISSDYFRVQIP